MALLAAPAAQGAFVGSGEDPAGDAPAPGLDITDAAFGYDREGRIAAGVRLRAAPSGDATVVVYAGTRTATGCDRAPTFGFAGPTSSRDGRWLRIDGSGSVEASGYAENDGYPTRTLRFTADDAQLRGLRPNCVQVGVAASDGSRTVYDALVLDLKPQPGLGLRLTGLPKTVRPGRRRTLRVTVSNPGDAPTGRVRVRLAGLRGLRVPRRTVTVPSVAPGRRRTVRLGVTFTPRAHTVNDLTVKAKAGTLHVEAERRVVVRIPSKKAPEGGGGGAGGTPSTCVRYFPDLSGESGGSLGLVPCLR